MFSAASGEPPGATAGITSPGLKCTVVANILGTQVRTLVDTGAEAGGISSTVVDADPRLLRYIHRRRAKTCVSVNKTPLNSPFSLLIPIQIGQKQFHYEVNVIKNLVNPLLIGLDFLTKHGAILNFAKNELIIDQYPVPIGHAPCQSSAPTHVALTEDVSLAPESLNLVSVSIEGPDPRANPNKPKTMLIRPLMGDREEELPVMSAWGVIDLEQETHVIEILNPTKEEVVLRRGTPVAVEENLDPEIWTESQQQPTTVLAAASTSESPSNPPIVKPDGEPKAKLEGDELEFRVSLEGSLLNKEQRDEFREICNEYEGIFARHKHDLGKTKLTHHYIELTTDKPITAPQYKTPPPDVREEIDRETSELISMGVAQESNSPYSAPILLVRKKQGGWRYCTDFRRLNACTVKASFPLPNIQDSIRRFRNPKVITTMDLLKGYFQVEVAEAHRKFFAFSDGRRHLEYLRTPMGAKNSGATMAALMELVMRGLPTQYVLAYLDDIIICTPDIQTHFEVIRGVFKALADSGLKVHPAKCNFFRSEAVVLGYVISEEGIKPDPHNLKKISEWPVPKNESEVRGFIGLCNYYRSHLPNFAKISEPMTNLLLKDQPFSWSDAQQKSYEALKSMLLEGTACAFPDFKRDFILKTDASDTTVGCVLSQRDERNCEQMVACASQKLTRQQAAWCTYDKEFWALVWATRQFSHYLRYRKFLCFTDHRPLLSCRTLNDEKDATGRRTRWAIELASYEMDLRHKEGKKNSDADALSRAPHPDGPRTPDEEYVFLGAMSTSEAPAAEVLSNVDEDLEKRFREGQNDDPDTRLAKCWVYEGTDKPAPKGLSPWYVTNKDNLRVSDGLLYQSFKDALGETCLRIVVPYLLIGEVLHRIHGDKFAGHMGQKRSLSRALKFCIWPTMRRDIEEKVKSCPECQMCRGETNYKKVVRVLPQKAKYPLHTIQADLLELPILSHGCDHILVIEDVYTKYCCFYPMAGKQAVTVAKHLWQFIRRFGSPAIWRTDNGGEFKNQLIEALTKVYGIRKEFGMAYHPASQGQTERKNRTIIAELCKRVAQWGPQWTKYLPSLELGYNTTPHTSDGLTPHLKMFGREARVPLQDALPSPPETKDWSKDTKTYVQHHQKQLEKIHELKEELHTNYMEKMAQPPKGKTHTDPFQKGEQVMRELHLNKGNKMKVKFDGPWEVHERIDPPDHEIGNTYVIRRDDEELVRPQCDLKQYHTPKFPGPQEKTELIDPTPTLEENSQQKLNPKALELLLAVSNIVTGVRKKPNSSAHVGGSSQASNNGNGQQGHSGHSAAIPPVPLPTPSSPLQVVTATAPNRNNPAGAIPKARSIPKPKAVPASKIPSLTRLQIAPSTSSDINQHLQAISNNEGISEQVPLQELVDDSDEETSNQPRSISDVFRLTGLTPTMFKTGSSRSSSASSRTPKAGPSTSTPRSIPTMVTSAPKKPRQANTPITPQTSRPRTSSAPEAAATAAAASPALVASKKTIQALKKLQSHNNPGFSEQAIDELPPRRAAKPKQQS